MRLVLLALLAPAIGALHGCMHLSLSRRAGIPLMTRGETKAERLVRQRLDPRADLGTMNQQQLRKYAYAMQIEVQRLIRDEQQQTELRRQLRALLDANEIGSMEEDASSASIDVGALITAMKMEGLVRYSLPHATSTTSWGKVRSNHPEFADNSDDELYAAFQGSGKGISGFGDLW